MKEQITFQLVRILNWQSNEQQVVIDVTFLSAQNQTYIAHKTLISQNIQNSLILNEQFKISFQKSQNLILCKISLLSEPNKKKSLIAQAHIDMNLLSAINGNVLYLPVNKDPKKLLEIHRIDFQEQLNSKNNSYLKTYELDQKTQQQFLKQRYQFLQRISHRQIEMKKNISEKVYNLLKDIRYARATDQTKKQLQQKKNKKDTLEMNQNAYLTPLRDNIELDPNQINERKGNFDEEIMIDRNPKHMKNQKLMLDLMGQYGSKDKGYNIRNESMY